MENKTFKIRFPNIEESYYNDFIRGYFDGDGCFYISKKYSNNNRINIVSNKYFIYDLKKIIETTLNITCKISEIKNTDVERLNIYGNRKVKKFLDWIYNKSELKLSRKYIKYCEAYNPLDDAMGNAEALFAMKDLGLKIGLK